MVFIRVTKEGNSENALGQAYIVSDKSLLHERSTPCLSCLLPKQVTAEILETSLMGLFVITVSLSFFYMHSMDMMQKCGSEISV